MANVTTLKSGGTEFTPFGKMPRAVQKWNIDIAKAVAAGLATTEYVVVFDVPAKSKVVIHSLHNETALSMGSSPAISLGDAASATRFVNAATAVTAGTYHTVATSEFTYATGGQVRLTLTGGTLASGLLAVNFEIISLSANTVASV